jgi:hypothetical protein
MSLNQPCSRALEVSFNRQFDEFIHNKSAGLGSVGSHNIKGNMLKWTNDSLLINHRSNKDCNLT